MYTKHFWYNLLDKYGAPVSAGLVYIYEAESTTEINVYNEEETKVSQPLSTDSDGIFEFYIRKDETTDSTALSGSYTADVKMKLTWSASPDISGTVDNIEIFPQIYPVDDSITTLTSEHIKKINTVSNANAYKWDIHDDKLAQTEGVHNTFQVDITDSNDSAFNKKVSNKLLNDLYSILVSASNPIVTSTNPSASITRTYTVEASSWISSGGYYYNNVNHQLGLEQILHQIYDDSSEEVVKPYKVDYTDENNTIFWSTENSKSHITVAG